MPLIFFNTKKNPLPFAILNRRQRIFFIMFLFNSITLNAQIFFNKVLNCDTCLTTTYADGIFNQNLIVSGSPKLGNRTLGPNGAWFDKSVFAALPVLSAQTDPVSIRRTNPWTYDGVIGPGTSQVDMTLSKAFRIHEGWKFEFRVEGYNVANHINWDNPVVDFNNTANFGKVISKRPGYIGREVQYGFKLTF